MPRAPGCRCSGRRRRWRGSSAGSPGAPRRGSALLTKDQPDREPQLEALAQAVDEEAPVGVVHGLGTVALDRDRHRLGGHLVGVTEADRKAPKKRRRMFILHL